jgi:tetrahydromethanopterin S-methyltransferase subunit F
MNTSKNSTATQINAASEIIKHASQQLRREKKTQSLAAGLQAKLDAIDEKKRNIREREKALRRDQRLLMPAVNASKGALIAQFLLKILAVPELGDVVSRIDSQLAREDIAEAPQLKAMLALEVLTVDAFRQLLLPASNATSLQSAVDSFAPKDATTNDVVGRD